MSALKNILLGLVLLCSGCALFVVGGVAAVGTYTYTQGNLNRTYNANLEATVQATEAGCKSLGLPIMDSSKGLSEASIKTLDGERDVWIKLKAQSSHTTEVSIRIGYFGDEEGSRRIHEAIQARF